MSDIVLRKQPLSNADLNMGDVSLQVDENGNLCSITIDGVKRYSTGITAEDVQDIVGNSIESGGIVSVVYDDVGNKVVISLGEATTTSPGAMSTQDKTKLDSLTQYLIQATAPLSAVYNNANKTITLSATTATPTANGLMSKEDKAKLDGYSIPVKTKTLSNLYTSNSNYYTNITELTHNLEAGKAYFIDGVLRYRTASNTAGITLTAESPNAEMSLTMETVVRTAATSAIFAGEVYYSGITFRSTGVADSGQVHHVFVRGTVVPTQDTALDFLFTTEVNGSGVTLLSNSFIRAEEI